MPVNFPKGEEPSVLRENPNGPKQGDKDGSDQKPAAHDFISKGPVKADQLPPVLSEAEQQANKAKAEASGKQ